MSLRSTAFHEAGHAVAAIVLNARFRGVTLRPSRKNGSAGHVVLGIGQSTPTLLVVDSRLLRRAILVADLAVRLVPYTNWQWVRREWFFLPCLDDVAVVMKLAQLLPLGSGLREEVLTEAVGLADLIAGRYRGVIHVVAGELRKDPTRYHRRRDVVPLVHSTCDRLGVERRLSRRASRSTRPKESWVIVAKSWATLAIGGPREVNHD